MSDTFRFSTALSMIFGAAVSVAVGCGGSDASGGPAPGTGATGGSAASGGSGGSTGGSTSSGGTGGDAGEVGTGGSEPGSGGTTSSGGSGGSSGSGGATGGTGGSGTGGSGAAATDDLLDEIGGHCERDCDAQYALECAPANSNTLVCQLSCAAQTGQLGDFCLREYADLVACRADGGYACLTETQPYPNSTCAVESLAMNGCMENLGCKRQCALAIAEGCTTAPFDTCLDDCIATADDLPEDCARYRYTDAIASCRATQASPVCDGESINTPETCAYYVLEIGSCLQEESGNYCEGWCYVADTFDCGGTDCMADCEAKLMDATCGTAWQNVMDCGLRFGNAACVDGAFMANTSSCDSYTETYATCLAGDADAGT